MASSKSSKSPREKRSSTNDPEAFSRGDVQLDQEEPKATPIPDYSSENAKYDDGGGIYSRRR